MCKPRPLSPHIPFAEVTELQLSVISSSEQISHAELPWFMWTAVFPAGEHPARETLLGAGNQHWKERNDADRPATYPVSSTTRSGGWGTPWGGRTHPGWGSCGWAAATTTRCTPSTPARECSWRGSRWAEGLTGSRCGRSQAASPWTTRGTCADHPGLCSAPRLFQLLIWQGPVKPCPWFAVS